MVIPTLAIFVFLLSLAVVSAFPIPAPPPGEDFPISVTPAPGEEQGFATVSSAHQRGILQHLAALSYTDTVGGVRVTFGSAMLGAAGGATGAASAGGPQAGATIAGSTGPSGFGLALGSALGVQFGKGGPKIAAGAGATGSVGDAAMAAAGGQDTDAEATTNRPEFSSGAALAQANRGRGKTRALHGKSVTDKDSKTKQTSAAGARVKRAGGAAFITSGGTSGGATMASGSGAIDEKHKPAEGVVGSSDGAVAVGGVAAGPFRSATALLRGVNGKGNAKINATAGHPGVAAGSVVTGDAQAQARGR